jgi:hypothetical protein
MDNTTKVAENRVRRLAERRGYTLRKSRRRDAGALDYGVYWLVHTARNEIISPPEGISLTQAEEWLLAGGN